MMLRWTPAHECSTLIASYQCDHFTIRAWSQRFASTRKQMLYSVIKLSGLGSEILQQSLILTFISVTFGQAR